MIRNIIIINDFAHINGGAGKVAISSAVGLSRLGYNVTLFSAVAPIDAILEKTNVKVVCLGQKDILSEPDRLKAVKQGIWNGYAKKEFEKLLSTLNPSETIIHFHAWIKALSASLFEVTGRLGFKIVITLHDYFLFCPNGGIFNYQTLKICDKRASSLNCLLCNCDVRSYPQKIWRYLRQIVQWKTLKMNDRINIIYISNLNKEVSYTYLKHITNKWYYVINPVELTKGSSVDIVNNKKYIFIARLSKEKGVDLFCKAITDLHLEGCVLGDGYLKDELKEKYKNIKFVGWVEKEEKEQYLKQAQCIVFSSIWYETFGLVVAEGLSRGLPCIVGNNNAAKEMIVDGETGFIFKSGDLNSLKEAIMKYENSDKEYMQNMIIRTFDMEKYSLHNHCKTLIGVYLDILNEL